MEKDDLQNKDPEIVISAFQNASLFLAAYGWYFIFCLILVILAWSPLERKYRDWIRKKREQQRMAEYIQNPERIISMQENMLRHRQRLQEQNDLINKEHSEKIKKAEEAKRQEKIDKYKCFQAGTSYKEKTQEVKTEEKQSKVVNKKKDERLRGDNYNPLMGSSSGVCYRPSRRGGGSAGG